MNSPSMWAAQAVCFLILAGCVAGVPSSQIAPVEGERIDTMARMEGLRETTWQLEKMRVDGRPLPLVSGSAITLKFLGDGRIAGSASVNRYFGRWTQRGSQSSPWEVSRLATTRMTGPPDRMNQEAAYLKALEKSETIVRRDARLEIGNPGGSVRLIYRRIE